MTLDIRTRCSICAWREKCTKKFTIKEGGLHCPDYTRDKKFPEEYETGAGSAEASKPSAHKRIVDPFADS